MLETFKGEPWNLPYSTEQLQSAVANQVPRINETTKNFERWDIETSNWEDTGVCAEGKDGEVTTAQLNAAITSVNANLAPVETTSTASRSYTAGDLLIYDGVLREVTADIAEGETIEAGSNISADKVTLSEKVTQQLAAKADLVGGKVPLEQLPDDIGGLLPQAVVTTTAGASVTATLDDTTVGPVVAGEDGVATLDLPSFGTWTLTAVLDEKTASDAVEVTEVRQFEVELPIAPDVPEGAVAAYFVNAADGSDESGNGHPLTLQNCTVESEGSITGKSYVQITSNLTGTELWNNAPRAEAPFANVGGDILGLSLSCWIKDLPAPTSSSTTTFSGLAVVGLEVRDFNTWNDVCVWQPVRYNHAKAFEIHYSNREDGGAVEFISSANTAAVDTYIPSTAQWTHVVSVITPSSAVLYVNGVKYPMDVTNSVHIFPTNFNPIKAWPLNLGLAKTVGYQTITAACAGQKMSNIRLYARALTDEEVSALYNNGAGV